MIKSVLVMGGTGVMGASLIEQLQQRGYVVIVTTRQQITSNGIRYWQCNARKDAFLDELKNKHFDAIVDFMGYKTDEFKKRIDIMLSSTDHYCFISSARVFADSQQPITELSPKLLDVCTDSAYLQTDEYALTKARQERLLQSSPMSNWTIIRPYITYGRNRFQLEAMEKEEWLYRAMKGRTVLVSKDILDKRTTMTSGQDVARTIVSVLENDCSKGEDYNVVGTDSLRWREVLQLYAESFKTSIGKEMKIKEVDDAMEIHYPWAKYQVIYDRMFNRCFSNKKLSHLIDTSSFLSMKEGVQESIAKFLLNPSFKSIDWNMEASKDRITGEYTRLKDIPGLKTKGRYLYHRIFM